MIIQTSALFWKLNCSCLQIVEEDEAHICCFKH